MMTPEQLRDELESIRLRMGWTKVCILGFTPKKPVSSISNFQSEEGLRDALSQFINSEFTIAKRLPNVTKN